MKIRCEVSTKSNTIDSIKVEDLIDWLQQLPENARLKYDGIISGKIHITATWTEER